MEPEIGMSGGGDGEDGGRFEHWPTVRLRCPPGDVLDVHLADRSGTRMLGLALLERPPRGGVLITRCTSVHTVGMRFAIDVAFVGWPPQPGGAVPVLAVRSGVRPLHLAACPRRARAGRGRAVAALELEAGRADRLGLAPGAELVAL